jgi:hypothetical protein
MTIGLPLVTRINTLNECLIRLTMVPKLAYIGATTIVNAPLAVALAHTPGNRGFMYFVFSPFARF